MDWKTFIVQLVTALAWPVVIIVLCFQLKSQFADLMLRIKKLKHKETELEFSEKLHELTLKSEQQQKPRVNLERNPELIEQTKFLLRLSEISPRSSVIEAFRILESSSAKAVAVANPEIDPKRILAPTQKMELLKDKVLSRSQYVQFQALKELRNRAAHMEDFELESTPIENYIDIALDLANHLENYKP